MHSIHQGLKLVFALCVVLLLCCVLPSIPSWMTQTNYVKTSRSVNDTVRLGMSERQGIEALSHISTISVHYKEKVPCQWVDHKLIINDRAEIFVYPRDYWQWYPSQFIACFDDKGILVYFQEEFP
jgi:hypothetical protein